MIRLFLRFLAVIVVLTTALLISKAQNGTIYKKPRVINMTDLGADPDDIQSMVRYLVQSNEYDTEGLIVTTGCWRKSQSNINMLTNILNAYGQVVSNLQVHDPDFPSLEYLQSVSALGQRGYGMGNVGEGKDSPGSELIISVVDKDDPRPVWVCFWGGGNTLAQALWKVQNTRSEEELNEFISKIRVYDILGQDNAGTWIAKNFPDLIYIRATSVYNWQPSDSWIDSNVQNHGPLGAVYPDRKYATEGDTPAFLHLFPNGLNNPDKVWQGGWGGRFGRTKKAGIRGMSCMSGEDAVYDPYYMYGNVEDNSRWETAIHNDFEARMDWSVTNNYAEANHHPIAIVNGDSSLQVIEVPAKPGSTINLSAEGSSDPDGQSLSYKWFYYKGAGTYDGSVIVQNSTSASASVVIPEDATGKEIHIILEMHDSGSPALYAYRRVIINTKLRVIMTTDHPDIAWTQGGDPDDIQSMVRFLLFSNEFDVEGIVASAGTNSFTADKSRILEVLDYYDMVDENLRNHAPGYPTADYLRSITYQGLGNEGPISIQWHCDNGNWEDIIGEGRDCEASEAIIAAADKDDPRPVYIGVWGGPRDIAQAIWKVKNTRTQEEFEAFISKLRIFLIHCQDATNQYLMDIPDLFVVWSRYTYLGMFGVDNRAWVLENIKNNHGPLCALYPDYNYKGEPAGVVEGDSPSFMWLLSANRAINNPEDPTQPSWGGQYPRIPGTNNKYGGPEYEGPKSSISQWADDFQPLFAERADWCLSEEVVVEGDDESDVWLEAECGKVGTLWDVKNDASASDGKYITIKSGNNSTDNAPTSSNDQVSFSININESGTFTLWARVITPSYDDDSFWLKMDNGEWNMWNNIASSSSWTWASEYSFYLSSGSHTLTIAYREDGAKLDKLYLTKTNASPVGEGKDAGNCANSTGQYLLPGDGKIFIHPNPADCELFVSFVGFQEKYNSLSIYNVNGKLIKSVSVTGNKKNIDISEICPGQYFLVVNDARICEKFTIK
ncbi:MAG: DUF1593 domain-containing protein [Prolixibacteraceae bacterium]|nr:DUF1593 domain-containing protein [Prolixibacteraceae bacterium]